MAFELRGGCAVITGGGSGIGAGMARAFAARGMQVVIADIEDAVAEATASALRATGAEAVAMHVDVSDRSSVGELAAQVFDTFGAVRVLCNNAGVVRFGPLVDMTPDDWTWVIGTNLFGVAHGVSEFVPRMLAQGRPGVIVNTGSIAAVRDEPMNGFGVYAAAKHAVLGLSDTLARELAGTDLGVCVLLPGPVDTDISRSVRNRPGEWAVPPRRTNADRVAEGITELALSPDEVGEIVARAIEEGRRYVFTHPEMRADVELVHRRVMQGFDQADG